MAVSAATVVRCWESGMLLVLPGGERAGCCWYCLVLRERDAVGFA